MRFAKYHGIGNDFVMIADPEDRLKLTDGLVRRLCDRRFGIGGDGVIRVTRGDDGAELFMDYVNSDGSVGEMCGNGIRCLAVFAREQGLTTAEELKVATRAGLKVVTLLRDGRVRVDMGAPIFEAADIPVRATADPLHVPVDVVGESYVGACLSMGNPHVVFFVEEPNDVPVGSLGPLIEHHDLFPNQTNAEWARVESPTRVRMRVWERGSGETLACGTGACAVAVAARLLHNTEEVTTIALPGGELEVEWAGSLDREAPVYLTGPVEKAFDGEVEI